MQRQIKFRVFDKVKEKMINPSGGACMDVSQTQGVDRWVFGIDLFNHPDDVEIMQYTGLKDKLGNDIYEGDLLRNPAGVTAWDENNFTAYEVFYHDNDCADRHVGFQMNRVHFQGNVAGTSQFPGFLPKNTEQMVVIGNIYENKELLK